MLLAHKESLISVPSTVSTVMDGARAIDRAAGKKTAFAPLPNTASWLNYSSPDESASLNLSHGSSRNENGHEGLPENQFQPSHPQVTNIRLALEEKRRKRQGDVTKKGYEWMQQNAKFGESAFMQSGKGGSTQNRWLLMGDFSKGGVHKTDGLWWMIFKGGSTQNRWALMDDFQRGEYTKLMGFDGWFFKGGSTQNRWGLMGFGMFLFSTLTRPGRLFRRIRYSYEKTLYQNDVFSILWIIVDCFDSMRDCSSKLNWKPFRQWKMLQK